MDLAELQKKLKSRELSPVYVFAGSETSIIRRYIEEVCSASSYPKESIDAVSSLQSRLSRKSLVKKSRVFVVYDDKSFVQNEPLWSVFEDIVKRSANIVILVYTKFDKRSKFFKHFDVVEFSSMNLDVLSQRIKRCSTLSDESCKLLAEYCDCSYNRCELELHKIQSYTHFMKISDEGVTDDEAFKILLQEGLIHKEESSAAFPLVDAILCRNDVKKIEGLLSQYRRNKEPVLLALSLLYSRFRSLLMYQELPDKSLAESSAGLSKYEVYSCRYNLNHYTTNELVRALKLLQSLETGIKLGAYEERIALDYFIAEVI